MDRYETLAHELFASMDRHKKGPPHEEVSRTMRGEMAVLCLLMNEGKAMTAGELSRTLSMTTSRIAAVLGSLEKKGMLVRMPDETDKRRVLAALTPQGRTVCQRRKAHAHEHMALMLRWLGEDDAAHFVRIMKRIHEYMPDHPLQGGDEFCESKKEESAE
ncbi:MAG: winged helix DNA-binding protein [Clostridia bacterium]|nr:winged helix DNA-binding protein [Clostridia bacterium]